METYQKDTMLVGNPDAVLRARDVIDIKEMLVYCNDKKIPVTFCGSQTSMTGASVAMNGVLISTEKMEDVIDVDQNKKLARVQPGIIISDLKKYLSPLGLTYPPAPTSQDSARVGASISTNATGEDSFKYGPTRIYVEELKIILADGNEKIFKRDKSENIYGGLDKAGYLLESKNPIDHFIGGEGTLGFISEALVRVIDLPAGFFSVLVPFPSNSKAIEFIVHIVKNKKTSLDPRALEFIDETALSFMKTHRTFPDGLKNAKSLVYFKQEFSSDAQMSEKLDLWMKEICAYSTPQLSEAGIIAVDNSKKEEMRLWRHQIPVKINETYAQYWTQGGGKIGSDWWVPVGKLSEMMAFVYKTGEEAKIPFLAFAHLGMGHPHVNYLCKTPEEKARAEKLLLLCCQKAVSLGGGVAGEHGIGKIHHDLAEIQWNKTILTKMKKIKSHYDPNWILGQGNIFNQWD